MSESVAELDHRAIAIDAFNRSWDLIDRTDRTPDDDAELLTLVFASRHHWSMVGTLENLALADHQISKAAAILGHPRLSERFAARALAVAEAEEWSGWKMAACYEGMARSAHASADWPAYQRWADATRRALDAIDDPDERDVIESQFNEYGPPPAV